MRKTTAYTVGLLVVCRAALAFASAPIAVKNSNLIFSKPTYLPATPADPYTQTFVNNLDTLQSLSLYISGPGCANDNVIVQFYDGCRNNFLGTGSGPINTSTLQAGQTRLVTIPILPPNGIAMAYGKYYSVDVSTKCAKVVTNTDEYNMGIGMTPETGEGFHGQWGTETTYPLKKQDLMFELDGTTTIAKAVDPNPTTNVACSNPAGSWASQCLPVYPENGVGGARNYLNVLIRESHKDMGWPTASDNSFWLDYTYNSSPPGTVNSILIPEIKLALDQTLGGNQPALRQTAPWSTLWGAGANPAKMNFYVSVQDPRRDPFGTRGVTNCANIDLYIDLQDDPGMHLGPAGASFGARAFFEAFVWRAGANLAGWGDTGESTGGSERELFLREPFGSMGLGDEFFCAPIAGSTCTPSTSPPFYSLNTAPPGCDDPTSSNWCASHHPVSWLVAMSQSNPRDWANGCWSSTVSQTQCLANPNCMWIQGLPNVSYYAPYTCIPSTIGEYDIGIDCGGAACYLGGGSLLSSPIITVNAGQPGDLIMQEGNEQRFVLTNGIWSAEQTLGEPGYGPLLPQMTLLLECLFPTDCARYDQVACDDFVAKWDGGWYGEPPSTRNPNNTSFMQAGLACVNGISKRR